MKGLRGPLAHRWDQLWHRMGAPFGREGQSREPGDASIAGFVVLFHSLGLWQVFARSLSHPPAPP